MPVESDSSTSEGSETETSSSLPVSESTVSDETESAFGSETAESDVDAKDEDSSGVTAATADEQSVSVTVSEEYAILLATNQADSMMGHAGMRRSDACTQPAASFVLADYAAETEDESYCLLWEAMNAEFEQLGAQGCTTANCVFTDGMIILMR
jgi:recombination DNA repair RAD52 pathway protein